MLADEERTKSSEIGHGTIVGVNSDGEPIDILLHNVVCVLKWASGLSSVGTLANKGFKVMFCGDRCEVQDQQGRIIALTLRLGTLYTLCTPEHTENC